MRIVRTSVDGTWTTCWCCGNEWNTFGIPIPGQLCNVCILRESVIRENNRRWDEAQAARKWRRWVVRVCWLVALVLMLREWWS